MRRLSHGVDSSKHAVAAARSVCISTRLSTSALRFSLTRFAAATLPAALCCAVRVWHIAPLLQLRIPLISAIAIGFLSSHHHHHHHPSTFRQSRPLLLSSLLLAALARTGSFLGFDSLTLLAAHLTSSTNLFRDDFTSSLLRHLGHLSARSIQTYPGTDDNSSSTVLLTLQVTLVYTASSSHK